jgi:hypothetical protein
MKTHRITVPVIFWCEALHASRRSKRERFNGYIPLEVEIPEYDTLEAPLACRYPEGYKPEPTTPVRFNGGRFFEPVSQGSVGQNTLQYVRAEDFLNNAISGYSTGNPLSRPGGPVSEYLRGELMPFTSEAFKDYDKAAAKKYTDEIVDSAKSLAMIDGLLWEEVGQPVYKIVSPMHYERQRYSAWVQVEHLADDTNRCEIIPLSNWEDAVDTIKTRFGDDLSAEWQAQVYLPDVFTFDFTNKLVLDDLTRAKDAHYKSIGSADEETIIAWVRFRDAVDRAIVSPNDALIDDAIDRYGNAYRMSPQPNKDGISYLNNAQDRWNMRVIAPASSRLG